MHSIFTAATAMAIFWLWAAVYFIVLRCQPPASYIRYIECSSVLVLALGVNQAITKLHRLDLLQLDIFGALQLSIKQAVTVLCVILLYLFAVRDSSMSRIFLFAFVALLCPVAVLLNANLPRLLASKVFDMSHRQKTILLGSAVQVEHFTTWLKNKSRYGVDVVGIITEKPETSTNLAWPVLGCIADFEKIVAENEVCQIISLYLPNSLPRAARLGKVCECLGARLMFVNDIETKFSRSVHFFEDAGVHLISLRDEPLECPFNRLVKRILDLAISLPVALIILPPICLFVWVTHRMQSPGPLFFRQMRTGFQRRPFEIIKFRTMHCQDHDETIQATQGDPRVFPIGRWLRRLSIDELPQFLNVLRGDMSVVGPRPHMLEHDTAFAKSAEIYRLRSFVRPGITGLAQVSGFRGEARHPKDVIARADSDVYYLEHWTFGLDWAIIIQTAWQCVRPPRTAY